MKSRNKIIYWISTPPACIRNAVDRHRATAESRRAGTACYQPWLSRVFLTIPGAWKIAGIIVLLLPKLPLLKEWAYDRRLTTVSGNETQSLPFLNHINLKK